MELSLRADKLVTIICRLLFYSCFISFTLYFNVPQAYTASNLAIYLLSNQYVPTLISLLALTFFKLQSHIFRLLVTLFIVSLYRPIPKRSYKLTHLILLSIPAILVYFSRAKITVPNIITILFYVVNAICELSQPYPFNFLGNLAPSLVCAYNYTVGEAFILLLTACCSLPVVNGRLPTLRFYTTSLIVIVFVILSFIIYFDDSINLTHEVSTKYLTRSTQHPMSLENNIIIGAGITGLGAATRFIELGAPFRVYDSGQSIQSIIDSSVASRYASPDLPIHLQSHYQYFDSVLSAYTVEETPVPRISEAIWYEHEVFPINNNDSDLEYLATQISNQTEHCRSTLSSIYGTMLSDAMVIPYIDKTIGISCLNTSSSWLSSSLVNTYSDSIFPPLRTITNVNHTHTHTFNSSAALSKALNTIAAKIPKKQIYLQSKVTKIDLRAHMIHITGKKSRSSMKFNSIISSLPLPSLLSLIDHPEAEKYRSIANSLEYNNIKQIKLVISEPIPDKLKGIDILYFPAKEILFHRIMIDSPNDTATYSLMLELTTPNVSLESPEATLKKCVLSLISLNILTSLENIISHSIHDDPHAIPLPTSTRDAYLQQIDSWLTKHNIFSRGALGGWKLESIPVDFTFMQGVESVDAALFSVPEQTYYSPARAAANYNRREFSKIRKLAKINYISVSPGDIHVPVDEEAYNPNDVKLALIAIYISNPHTAIDQIRKFVNTFPLSSFDILILTPYKISLPDETWASRVSVNYANNASKWWFAKRFLNPSALESYDFIFFWDSLIDVNKFRPFVFLKWMQDNKLDIGQPCMSHCNSMKPYVCISNNLMEAKNLHRLAKKNTHNMVSYAESSAVVFTSKIWSEFVYNMIQWDIHFSSHYMNLFSSVNPQLKSAVTMSTYVGCDAPLEDTMPPFTQFDEVLFERFSVESKSPVVLQTA